MKAIPLISSFLPIAASRRVAAFRRAASFRRAAVVGAIFALAAAASAQNLWDRAHIDNVKSALSRPYYAATYRALIHEADSLLSVKPLSVMDKQAVAASGDKHDYLSQARYAWPNPNTPDGLPYINRDGVTNPAIYKLDRYALSATAERITRLALAWYLSGEEQYAAKATELIGVWFLNEPTRMNPNLGYAQMVPGENGGRGRSFGLLDTYSFVEMVNALPLLEGSASFSESKSAALKEWFRELTRWMLTSEQGKQEDANANNHSVAYDAQIMAFSLYTGDKEQARRVAAEFPERRMRLQVAADGRQRMELSRTRAFHYSWYNLNHIIDIMLMAQSLNMDLPAMTRKAGIPGLDSALDFLIPFVEGGKETWPFQEIGDWEETSQNLLRDLYRAGTRLYPERKEYRELYEAERIYSAAELFNLVDMEPSAIDDAFAEAAAQLEFASKLVDTQAAKPENAAKKKVAPRSMAKGGKLTLVDAHDWCSGFFAGSLWQIFDYTNCAQWRQLAERHTAPLAEAKDDRNHHDVGFIINNSFGKEYALTGDSAARRAVIDAASALISRFDPKVGCIRSWDFNREVWQYPVIIDNMMNLELLFDAWRLTGDGRYRNVAVSHADKTLENHFRDDGSSFHVVDYDPLTGHRRLRCTFQGYADDSFWSRGQAWGLYGYAMCYRYTRLERYLRQSEAIADFLMALPNMPADLVPYWDMKHPDAARCTPEKTNPAVPRDASAAAVMASGLYELSLYAESEKGAKYKEYADRIVDSLIRNYMSPTGKNCGFLLLHSTGHLPAGSEIDVPLSYADYYFLEALSRRRKIEGAGVRPAVSGKPE